MKNSHIRQHGAVLAFSLVMLVLLTLVTVSMIQRNKLQVAVANNAKMQTQTFSAVENALALAQNALEAQRYADKTKNRCNSGTGANRIDEQEVLNTGMPTITARVVAVYCINGYGSPLAKEIRCTYTNGNRDGVLACDLLNNAGTYQSATGPISDTACRVEEYTLNLEMIDSISGAKRTIQSKFMVNCSGVVPP